MKLLVIDVETTIAAKGHVYHKDNKLCYVGLFDGSTYDLYDIEYSANPYASKLLEIKRRIEEADLVIGFNLKFDLSWLKRYIPNVKFGTIHDSQLHYFLTMDHRHRFPSLDQVATHYSLGTKLDVVSTHYWANGIDTPDIPEHVLTDYLRQDLKLTYEVYCKQLEDSEHLRIRRLFELQCRDLLILREMEENGLTYNLNEARRMHEAYTKDVARIDYNLNSLLGRTDLNYASPDHISSILFGGFIKQDYIEEYPFTYKDGRTTLKSRQAVRLIPVKGIGAKPAKGTETLPTKDWSEADLIRQNEKRKETGKLPVCRTYSVDEEVLRKLKVFGKGNKAVVQCILERREKAKVVSTYLEGLFQILEDKGWSDGVVHGNYNQTATTTGRLSSSNPNLQNIPSTVKHLYS